VRLQGIILTISASIPLAAQELPAAIINVYREQVKPGVMSKYLQIEEAAARFCAQAHCPNPYVAIASMTGPAEVWWINGVDSVETFEKVLHDYAANQEIMQELDRVASSKADLAFDSTTLVARFRDDLSFSSDTTIAYARYISISVVQVRPGQLASFEKIRQAVKAARQRSGRAQWVYQVASGTQDGTFLLMTPGRNLQEVHAFDTSDDRIPDSVLTSETRLYAVSPSLSMPAQNWVEADPAFWKRP
jgi:hypothetical protein